MADVLRDTKFNARMSNGWVVIEPDEVYGVKGFTMILSPAAAKQLGYEMVKLGVMALQPTTNSGGHG